MNLIFIFDDVPYSNICWKTFSTIPIIIKTLIKLVCGIGLGYSFALEINYWIIGIILIGIIVAIAFDFRQPII